jgi:2-polyprenyl-6-methoxyphenol hydroxylase-like FAD-dependent oxidoreductase
MQSMNVGLLEAEALATAVRRVVREAASLDTLEAYQKARRAEWQRLLGVTGSLKPGAKPNAWAKERAARLLPCLPAGVEEIGRLADQLGLVWE